MDRVTWFELPADDTARAGAFYAQVFGWKMGDMGGGSLWAQTSSSVGDDQMTPTEPGVINGDISPRSAGFNHPLIVITVQDMDEKIKLVTDAGGTIALEPQVVEAMNMKWAIVTDTEGNNVGILQDL